MSTPVPEFSLAPVSGSSSSSNAAGKRRACEAPIDSVEQHAEIDYLESEDDADELVLEDNRVPDVPTYYIQDFMNGTRQHFKYMPDSSGEKLKEIQAEKGQWQTTTHDSGEVSVNIKSEGGEGCYPKHPARLNYQAIVKRLQNEIPCVLTSRNTDPSAGGNSAAETDLVGLAQRDLNTLRDQQKDLEKAWQQERPLPQNVAEMRCEDDDGEGGDDLMDTEEGQGQGSLDDREEQRRQDQGQNTGLSFQDEVAHGMTDFKGSLSQGSYQKLLTLDEDTTPRMEAACFVCGGISGEGHCGFNTGVAPTVYDRECQECEDEEDGGNQGDGMSFRQRMRNTGSDGGWKCATFEQLVDMAIQRCGLSFTNHEAFTKEFLESHNHNEHPFQIPRMLADLLKNGNIKEYDRVTACCGNPKCLLLMGIDSFSRYARWLSSKQEPQHEVISDDKSDKHTLRRALMLAHMLYLIGCDEEAANTPPEQRLGLSTEQFKVLVEHTTMKSFWMQMRLRKYMACADFALVYSETGKFPFRFQSPPDVMVQMKALAKSYVTTDVIPGMLRCTRGAQISTELKKFIGGDFEPQAQDALLAIMVREHQEKHGNLREGFVPLSGAMNNVPTELTGGVNTIFGPYQAELAEEVDAKRVQRASYIAQMAYHNDEPVRDVYTRWKILPRLKLEVDPSKDGDGWVFTNPGWLETCYTLLLDGSHSVRIYYARGDDAGAMSAAFRNLKQANPRAKNYEIWNLVRSTGSRYGKMGVTFGTFSAASPFSDGATSNHGNVHPQRRLRSCFRGLGDPEFSTVMEKYAEMMTQVSMIDDGAKKRAVAHRWMDETLSLPSDAERCDSVLMFHPCGNKTGCQTYWSRSTKLGADAYATGNSASCYTLKFPTWSTGEDPGFPSLELTMQDRVEARDAKTQPLTRMTMIGIAFAKAKKKQVAKTAARGMHQPDCIALGGNTSRDRVAAALGHAREMPHTTATSAYAYNEDLARAVHGRRFEDPTHTTTVCDRFNQLPELRTMPSMLGFGHPERLTVPDTGDLVYDASLRLGDPDDTKSMGVRLSKYEEWLQVQKRSEPRFSRGQRWPGGGGSGCGLRNGTPNAPNAMARGMLRTEPLDKEPTWTKHNGPRLQALKPTRFNWIGPAAHRAVQAAINWNNADDQEWKRQKTLDSKERVVQDSRIPPPGMQITGLQRLARAEAARTKYVAQRKYLAAHNDNGKRGEPNLLRTMPVGVDMSVRQGVYDFVTYEISVAKQIAMPELKKLLHLQDQFTIGKPSCCGVLTDHRPPHVAIAKLPDVLGGKDGWLMAHATNAAERLKCGIVEYPFHLHKTTTKTVLTLATFEDFETKFRTRAQNLDKALQDRIQALEDLKLCADDGELDFPQGFDPWKEQFAPAAHITAMPIWKEFEQWANERYGSLAQQHSYQRKLAAQLDWQNSCKRDSWKSCRPMKLMEEQTIFQRAELNVWATRIEEDLKFSSLRPDYIFGEGVESQNLNESERKRAGFNLKCRLILADRYAPDKLPEQTDNTEIYRTFPKGRLNNDGEKQFQRGRRADTAFASLTPLPLEEVDEQDFGGQTDLSEERYDHSGTLVRIEPPWVPR